MEKNKEKNKEKNPEEINENNESENLEQEHEEIKNDNKSENKNDNSDEKTEALEEGTEETEEDKLKFEIKSLKEEKIRVLAEMENLRKRFDREKIDSIKYKNIKQCKIQSALHFNNHRAFPSLNFIFKNLNHLLKVDKIHGFKKIDDFSNPFGIWVSIDRF